MEGGKQKPKSEKKKVDRQNYMFVNQEDQELIKRPGEINGQAFKLENLSRCTVWLLDHFAQIYVDNCNECTFFIGAVKASIQIRKSKECRVSVACQQFRCTELHNSTLFLCVNSQPTIEASTGLKFAPYNFGYPGLREHLAAAGINIRENFWRYVHDMTPESGTWEILEPEPLETQLKEIEGEEEPELVVPIPIRYGGTQEESEEAALETENGDFSIAKTKDEAKSQMQKLEEDEKSSDLKPKKDFSELGLDSFSNADIEFIQKEQERENKRMSDLMKKQGEEQRQKAKRQEDGARDYKNWIANWKKANAERKKINLKAQSEKLDAQKKKPGAQSNPWIAISNLIGEQYVGGKDLTRMKSVINERKTDKIPANLA